MNNQNKLNKELIYSIIFFTSATVWACSDTFIHLLDLLSRIPLDIQYKLINLGLDPLSQQLVALSYYFILLFLACAIYLGVKSIKKIPAIERKKGVLSFLPQTTQGTIAFIVVSLSICEFVLITIGTFIAYI